MIELSERILTVLVLSIMMLLTLVWPLSSITAAATYYVAPNANCGSATPCYAMLQTAIDAAQPGDEIRVAQGVYTSTTAFEYNLGGWTQTITQVMFIDKSLTLRGGYTITDWTTTQPISYPTIINPEGHGRGGVIVDPDHNTSITVILEGLEITEGYAQGSGGGLYAEATSITVNDCHIHHNAGTSLSDGMYLIGENISLTHNIIAHNSSSTDGYGAFIQGFPTLSQNSIISNTNGLSLQNARAVLVNNLIAANKQNGLSVTGGEVQAWHTTLADNGTTGVYVMNSGQGAGQLVMTNTIIAGSNTGVETVGNDFNPSTVQLTATLWDNMTDTQIIDAGELITHTRDFQGDPAFAGNGDYHLTEDSPARNRGWASDVPVDIDGEARDPLPDLGADEYFDPGSIRQVFLPLILR